MSTSNVLVLQVKLDSRLYSFFFGSEVFSSLEFVVWSAPGVSVMFVGMILLLYS